MPTNLSNPVVTPANRQGTLTGVTPTQSNDGKFIWSVVGESSDGTAIVFKAVGLGTINSGNTAGDTLQTYMTTSSTSQTSFIQVTAVYSDKSDKNNWTVKVYSTGNTAQTFRKGGGGGH